MTVAPSPSRGAGAIAGVAGAIAAAGPGGPAKRGQQMGPHRPRAAAARTDRRGVRFTLTRRPSAMHARPDSPRLGPPRPARRSATASSARQRRWPRPALRPSAERGPRPPCAELTDEPATTRWRPAGSRSDDRHRPGRPVPGDLDHHGREGGGVGSLLSLDGSSVNRRRTSWRRSRRWLPGGLAELRLQGAAAAPPPSAQPSVVLSR